MKKISGTQSAAIEAILRLSAILESSDLHCLVTLACNSQGIASLHEIAGAKPAGPEQGSPEISLVVVTWVSD